MLTDLLALTPPFELYSTAGDTTPPATPTGLTATNGDGQVVLSWNANTEIDLKDYQIYHSLSAGGPYSVLTTINSPSGSPATTYTHAGLTNGVSHYYKITARDTIVNESAQSAYVVGTPTGAGAAEGYYAKRAKMLRRAGPNNLASYSNLDNDTTTLDETNLQAAMNWADGYVDTRARVLLLTADSTATGGHMLATDNTFFARVSDLASDIAVAYIYSARGFTGDTQQTVEGQMADMDAKARKELDEILDAARIIQAQDAGTNGAEVITVGGCASARCNVVLPYWGWW